MRALSDISLGLALFAVGLVAGTFLCRLFVRRVSAPYLGLLGKLRGKAMCNECRARLPWKMEPNPDSWHTFACVTCEKDFRAC